MEFLEINSKNMFTLFLHMADFIYNRKLEGKIKKDILVLEEFGEVTWFFILSMHKAGWDTLKTNKRNRTFCQSVTSKFTLKIKNNISNKKNKIPKKERKVEIIRIPFPISPRLSKDMLRKSKFFKNKGKKSIKSKNNRDSWLYT